MTQEDLFEWALHQMNKYGIKDDQLDLPLATLKNKKENTSKVLYEDDGYYDL